MSYVNINTLETVEAVDIMLAHPNVSFPNRGWYDEDILPFGYAELHFPVEHPLPGTYEKLVETTPKEIDGKWYKQFEVVPMTAKEIEITNITFRTNLIEETKGYLNQWANTKDYDNITSLCTYANSSNPVYKAEGEYGVIARDVTWNKIYEILADVEANIRPMPTSFNSIKHELPILEWPSTN